VFGSALLRVTVNMTSGSGDAVARQITANVRQRAASGS
jgi:hypothetical protein